MKQEIIYLALHFVLCSLFFLLIQRPLFCIYNHKANAEKLKFNDILQIYRFGYKTDLIIAAYFTALPLLFLWVHAHFPIFNTKTPLIIYSIITSLVFGTITIADTALYKFWKFKIDSSVFAYLRSLKGAFASVSGLYIFTAFASIFFFSMLCMGAMWWLANEFAPQSTAESHNWLEHVGIFAGFLLTAGCLFIIIRGLGRRPNNPSMTFYCKNPFYNHSGLNPLYNMIYSFSVKDDFAKQFQAFDAEECRKEFEPLFPLKGTPELQLLNTSRPNVLFVVWESLCSRHVGSLGGMPNVTPNIDRLAKEGVYFTQCYAGSFRTDRGLVCLLSGYLGQPTTTVIRYTKKLPNLPALPRVFKNLGYETTAVHGGDLTIFHKSDYYWAAGHNRLISQKDFPTDAPTCKWGIHDGYVMSWLYDDIIKKTAQGKQWYTTFQTLSSHETWEVPYDRIKDNKIANSFAYVDDCFGKFIDKLKASPAWDNLLVICTGDHGVNIEESGTRSGNTHIPLLLLGGAIKQPMQIDKIVNQTDIAATLLGQMELPHDEFIFSRDVLADTYTYPFAFHAYNNGFIFRDKTGFTDFDNVANCAIIGEDERRERLGKVILQNLYTDLSKR